MKYLSILALLLTTKAWAFPEMVRHGYMHCIGCHTTMVGGGMLNEYGRTLSRELLSQPTLFGSASKEGDENLFGVLKPKEGMTFGGDIRTLQYFVESKQASRGRFFIMQVDLDAAWTVKERWRFFASIGRIEPRDQDAVAKDFIASPRHGVEYLITAPDAEKRMAIRAGRFMPAFGILIPEHTLVTRRLLDLGPGQERYGAELSWSDDSSAVIATGIAARMEGNDTEDESGGVIQATTAVGTKSKVGLNYYRTERKLSGVKYTREIYGAFAHIGFTKDVYGLLEIDRPRSAADKWGLVQLFKIGYEITQGVHLVGFQEYANLDMDKSNPKFEAYSAGVEWFPRTHWDFYGLYRRERDTGLGNDFQDVVWLLGHFYL